MIDSSEKRNRQLALNFRIRTFVKSTVKRCPVFAWGRKNYEQRLES